MIPDTEMVARRSELLAQVFLTRRLNITVHTFGEKGDEGIDFICTIHDKQVPGFLPFGVIVWGTAKELRTEADASSFGRQKKKGMKQTTFLIPVVVLMFSMHNDEGYFSWVVEPGQDSNQLFRVSELKFRSFDTRQLDRVVKRMTAWYDRLAAAILADAGETASSRSPDDE